MKKTQWKYRRNKENDTKEIKKKEMKIKEIKKRSNYIFGDFANTSITQLHSFL